MPYQQNYFPVHNFIRMIGMKSRRNDEEINFDSSISLPKLEFGEKFQKPLPPANIFLTGFMGAGKTSSGKLLAKALGVKFYDTDELLSKSLGMSIEKIFISKGELFFRDCETEVLKMLGEKPPGTCVIATGGGVVLREENREAMRQNGLIILLDITAAEAYRRLKNSGETRPLLKGENPKNSIEDLMEKRLPYYRKVDMIVETTDISLEETVNKIVVAIQKG